jgi:transposase
MIVLEPHGRSSKEVPVSILGGLDVHRRQITVDWVDRATGQAQRGQLTPATREGLVRWLAQLPDHHGAVAVEACTGWRFVVEELQTAGGRPAWPSRPRPRPCGAQAAGEDRPDRRPAAVGAAGTRPPAAGLDPAGASAGAAGAGAAAQDPGRSAHRLAAAAARGAVPPRPALPDHALQTQSTRSRLEQLALPQASRLQVTTALRQIDQLDLELDPLERWLRAFARRQPGCRALIDRHYGIGMLLAPTILAELGDARRFANGDAVVGHTGLDVTVHSSNSKRSPGHLSRQGRQVLRWALFEAAQCAARPTSPTTTSTPR